MPIVITADFPGISPDTYRKMHREIMSSGNPDGMIAHCCREKDGGIAVIDI